MLCFPFSKIPVQKFYTTRSNYIRSKFKSCYHEFTQRVHLFGMWWRFSGNFHCHHVSGSMKKFQSNTNEILLIFVSNVSRKTITFDAFPNVQNANINRLVRVPFWSIFPIVMVKRPPTQRLFIRWAVKCSAFVAIHHQKVHSTHLSK